MAFTNDDDFEFNDHGSIVTMRPLTDAARDWIEDNIGDDAQTFGDAVAIEPRYVADIVYGLQDDGLTCNVEVCGR